LGGRAYPAGGKAGLVHGNVGYAREKGGRMRENTA
jgi:hypothetical protein